MATFTITANTNWHSLTGRAGNDTYTLATNPNITLTLDGDTRYGPNTTAATGSIGVYNGNVVGGRMVVDGRNVRLIPYNSGSGNVPAADAVISQGGVTGKLLGVWSAINTTPTAAGAAMPATGFIKVRQKAGGNYAAGALTGVGATATGADVVGWIEVVYQDTFQPTVTSPNAGIELRGEWFEVGVTSGVRNQVLQAPASLPNTYYPGVWIETAAGSGVFDFWPSAATVTAVPTDARGQLVWCGSQGQIRIGNHGAGDAGVLPSAGLRVVVGNVITLNTNTTVGIANNKSPADDVRAQMSGNGTQYFVVEKVTFNTRLHGIQGLGSANAITGYASYIAGLDTLYVSSLIAWPCSKIGVGPSGLRTGVQAFGVANMVDAHTIDDVTVCAISGAANGIMVAFNNCMNGTYNRWKCTMMARTATNAGLIYGVLITASTCTFNDPICIGGSFTIFEGSTVNNLKYADKFFGTQDGVNPLSAVTVSVGSTLNGMSWLIADANTCHPFTTLLTIGQGSKTYNIGTPAAPLDLGSVNATNTVLSRASGIGPLAGRAARMTVRRVYTTAQRGASYTISGTSKNANFENIGFIKDGNYAISGINVVLRGMQFNALPTFPGRSSYQQFFLDAFYSDTQGLIDLYWAEPTTELPGANSFAKTSGVYLAQAGNGAVITTSSDHAEWTTHFFLGHTGFRNVTQATALNAVAHLGEYDIDKGGGFTGTYKTINAANLSAETGIDPAIGFRLKIRVSGLTSNTTNIADIRLFTTTTATERYRQYPLQPSTVTINGLVTGSRVKAYRVDTGAVIATGPEVAGVFEFVSDYVGQIAIEARKASAAPYYQPWLTLTTLSADSAVTLTAVQPRDDL